ncbi:MAG TPA: YkgJ family cysteine cluster protein [Kofleriaceae bacterium]|nr:YkgJ family cysteine cluster protein [Kofleriaceae bacterium]
MTPVRTLGQFVEAEQIVPWIAGTVAEIIHHAEHGAKQHGRRLKLTVSCTSCKATKTCCWSTVVARLYEGVVIADSLVRDGRDTPALREQLRARAEAMEATPPQEWRTPCVFLDERERCTVYDVRPVPCGAVLVYTDPVLCTTRAGQILGYVPAEERAAATAFEEPFRERMALRRKVGRRYLGVLPRMVLVALEAWDRTDFRDYLRQLPWPSDDEVARWG